ncbi:MAG: LuxR C-terminal-related transcriptional regulator [Thermoleophilia bacterium]
MTGGRAYVAAPPPLVGRDAAVETILALAAERPGAIVVAAEPGGGATRMAREAATRLALDGSQVIVAERRGPALERLAEALVAEGHEPDLVRASRLRPVVALLGDRSDEPTLPAELVRRFAGTRALVLLTAREVSPDAPTLMLDRLDAEASAELAGHAAPGIDRLARAAVAELSGGLPGRIVPLALAARRWAGGDAPFPVPDALRVRAETALRVLSPAARDVATWVAVLGTPATTAERIARVSAQDVAALEPALDEAVRAGILDEATGPPRPRWRFADPLVAAVALAGLGGGELRRRHGDALASGRSTGASPSVLVRHAVGASDPEAVVRYGVRAAAMAREAGDPELALAHSQRALAWWTDSLGEAARQAAVHERGMALLDLSAWAEAAEALEGAAATRLDMLLRDEALASASAASTARWSLGQHEAALRALQSHLTHSRDPSAPASRARGEALAQAAGMAVMTSRFGEAMNLAGDARSEAAGAGDHETSTRALIFMGMAESGRGGPGGLLHLARARREGHHAPGSAQRNETLAMIHESHVMLALGRPDEAAACAREGVARARELGLVDHELVLAGNLGESLAHGGELDEAREHLQRAAAGWEELGRGSPTPADPGLAWLLYAEGRIDNALDRYRDLVVASSGDAPLFEQLAPVAVGHALVAAAAGNAVEAARAVADALAAWELTDDRLASVPLLAAAAEVAPLPEARRRTGALADMAVAGAPLAGPFHAYATGQLARRGGTPDPAPFREAAAHFEAMGMRWWATRALFAAGASGDATDLAADDLLAAREAFRAMGAGGWRRRAEARLRAIGRRIPTRSPRPTTPGAGLSAREREVLQQLALGLKNRDIGERLFISERTVARHLGQIYSKLGVTTRTAAVRAGRATGILSGEVT